MFRQKPSLTNVPTDLLRTLVTVVDLGSYTRAAAALGVTQPAVSSQVKRLQSLLEAELFERSTQGVSLTSAGELVVGRARRMLSLNDEIVACAQGGEQSEEVVRIGTPSDFVASVLPETLARFRARRQDVRFLVRSDFYEPLVRQFHAGELDMLFHLSPERPLDARHCEEQEVVWVRGRQPFRLDLNRPIPLVSYSEPSVYYRLATKTLRAAGLDYEHVFMGPSMHSLTNAVAAGLGIMPFTRRRARAVGLVPWDDAPLPKPAPLYSAIFVRESGAREIYEQLADEMSTVLHGPPDLQARIYAALGPMPKASSAA
jgi:DNA-binding transcriptional LysR family regulator